MKKVKIIFSIFFSLIFLVSILFNVYFCVPSVNDFVNQQFNIKTERSENDKKLKDTQNKLSESLYELELLKSNYSDLQKEIEKLNSQISSKNDSILGLQAELEENFNEKAKVQAEKEKLEQEVVDLKAQVKSFETLQKAIDDRLSEIANLKLQVQELTEQKNSSEDLNGELQSQIDSLNETISRLEAEVEEYKKLQLQINEKEAKIQELEQKVSDLEGSNSSLETQLESLQGELEQTKEQLNEAQSRIEELEQEIEETTSKFSTTFSENSVDTIASISDIISSENMTSDQVKRTFGWNIGDKITFSFTAGESFEMCILGFNHDDKSDGTGKAGITLGMTNCLSKNYKMNSKSTNVGGWDKSEMRTSTMVTLFSQLPTDLQKVIKAVNKKASADNKETTITTSSDKLWLLCEEEISGKTTFSTGGEGTQYEYWRTVKDGTVDANRVKNCNVSADNWWLRSPRASYDYYFCFVMNNGYFNVDTSYSSHSVSFCFCI